MSKKHLLSLLTLLMVAMAANAGTWKIHNVYLASKIQNVYDIGDKVYYLSGNMLCQYDKNTQEIVTLNSQNVLSDKTVNQIYYDVDRGLLFVAYADANIDVIDSSGKVTNISAIKDAIGRVYGAKLTDGVLTSCLDKKIFNINFVDGIAYVAVGYGYVMIDESTLRVIKDTVLGESICVNSVTPLGENLLILSNTYCYYGPIGETEPIRRYNKYKLTSSSFTEGFMYPINDHSVFVVGASALYNFDFADDTLVVSTLVSAKPTTIQKTSTGFVANFTGKAFYYTIDATGKVATQASTEQGFATSNPSGDGTVWIADANGLHIQNSTEYHKQNSMTTNRPHWLKYNTAMDLLYVGVSGRNGDLSVASNELPDNVINIYDGTNWTDATAYTAAGAGYAFVFNPLDSTTYFRPSWNKGIHKVTNNVLKLTYTKSNSMIGTYKPNVAFDNYGNLWTVCSYGNKSCPAAVLVKDSVANNHIAKSHWYQPDGLLDLHTGYMQRSSFVISKLNNVKIYTDGDFKKLGNIGRIFCWDNFNEDPTVNNYTMKIIPFFTDQRNKMVDWEYIWKMEEDAEGLVWVGHSAGLFVINPLELFDDQPKAIRPVITNSSESKGYLCEGYSVHDIAIDQDNNKWLGTNNGLFFVSHDGSVIYEHFTTLNSDLPGNMVYSVECDPKHGRVFIYTDGGFAEYIPAGDAPALNYDNVYAFPNPVEPDFTSMIKIANLMENTYVTITDKDGQVIEQIGPVSGSALWDGSGADGARVPTGLYNIYVAQGGQPVTSGKPQATVMIIK